MHSTVEHAAEIVGRVHMPASVTYTLASVYAFVKAAPIDVGDMSLVEAFVRVSETFVLSIPQTLGGVALVMGGYLSYLLRRAKIERDQAKDDRDHEYRMELLRTGCSSNIACIPPSGFDHKSQAEEQDTEDVP